MSECGECNICDKECNTMIPRGGYYHEECLSSWFLSKEYENLDIEDFVNNYENDSKILLKNEINFINKAYSHKLDNDIISDIFHEVNHTSSHKSNAIFRVMLENNMIKKNNYENVISNKIKVNNVNIECKIRPECIGHTCNESSGRCCKWYLCNSCNKTSGGRCMNRFEHCCCYILN